MSAITVSGLTKHFGSTLAVDNVSFEVDAGTIVGFLGPNGAGKTTTLRMLLGLVHPTKGTATINGRAYADLDDPIREVGAVLEGSSFHPARSGRSHLQVLCYSSGLSRHRVDEVLEIVGLQGNARRRVGGYSLGMRQRLGLATALLGQPRVLVLDEPANGLDPEGIRWMRERLRALAADGCTVLVSSHVLSEVAQTVDQVIIIADGRLITQAPLDQLTHGLDRLVRVRGPEPDQLRATLFDNGFDVRASEDGAILVAGTDAEQVGMAIARAGIPFHELVVEKSNLEQVFLDLISEPDKSRRPPPKEVNP